MTDNLNEQTPIQEEIVQVAPEVVEEVSVVVPEVAEEQVTTHRDPEELRRIRNEERNKLSIEDRKYWDVGGWRPKELFAGKNKDGSPKEWIPLEKFKENYENNPAIRAERERNLERKLEAMNSNVERITKFNQMKLEKEHKALEAKIDRDLKEAESIGDLDGYKTALHQKQSLENERAEINKVDTSSQTPAIDPIVAHEVEEFRNRNSWFDNDEIMKRASVEQFDFLNRTRPELSVREKLLKVEKVIRETFEHKFPSERNIPQVETSRTSGTMTLARTNAPSPVSFAKLPEHEQRQVEQLAKMKKTTKEEIIKKYYTNTKK